MLHLNNLVLLNSQKIQSLMPNQNIELHHHYVHEQVIAVI